MYMRWGLSIHDRRSVRLQEPCRLAVLREGLHVLVLGLQQFLLGPGPREAYLQKVPLAHSAAAVHLLRARLGFSHSFHHFLGGLPCPQGSLDRRFGLPQFRLHRSQQELQVEAGQLGLGIGLVELRTAPPPSRISQEADANGPAVRSGRLQVLQKLSPLLVFRPGAFEFGLGVAEG